MQTLRKFALVALLVASGFVGCTEKATEQTATQCPQNAVAYVASVHCAPFHRPHCRSAQRISPGNLQSFSTREGAIQAGHRPCKVCKP
jgi:methylphosphotriester-DNA--protein-cysteine methyltransferase